jgi:SAM-dependent methyltransferase
LACDGIYPTESEESMNQGIQDNSGLKKILTISRIYDLFQNLAGGVNGRKWIAKNIWKLKGPERVVDIGCGPGSSLKYLPVNTQYWGFDISENYIEAARKRLSDRGTFLVGTARDFLDSTDTDTRLTDAGLVLCNGLLHHLPDDEVMEILELAKRIMRPNGRLVCVEPTFLARQTRLSRWIISKDRGRYVRSEQEWKNLIGRAFDYYSTNIVTGLIRIPYTHIIIECFKDPSSPNAEIS